MRAIQRGRTLRTTGCLSAARETANEFFNADCGRGEPCLGCDAARHHDLRLISIAACASSIDRLRTSSCVSWSTWSGMSIGRFPRLFLDRRRSFIPEASTRDAPVLRLDTPGERSTISNADRGDRRAHESGRSEQGGKSTQGFHRQHQSTGTLPISARYIVVRKSDKACGRKDSLVATEVTDS